MIFILVHRSLLCDCILTINYNEDEQSYNLEKETEDTKGIFQIEIGNSLATNEKNERQTNNSIQDKLNN